MTPWETRALYQGYAYAYPHKTAYRTLVPPVPLETLWASENREALFLYMHIPFCEMRCGFCNLFTTIHADQSLEDAYMDTLERQVRRVRESIGDVSIARMAIGGGTPTYLSLENLTRLFDLTETVYGVKAHVPTSVETSPQTSETPKLELLKARGVDRISIGVQSFIESEVNAVGRPQTTAEVCAALDRIRAVGFATLNLDLIYGIPNQTEETWLESIRQALTWQPEELYLYPLYKRPLTGLDRMRPHDWDDERLALYRAGRDYLLERGYTQVSMRMFRAAHAPNQDAPIYCCQDDGMIGLGCGARSYTKALHYSSEWAVTYGSVRVILADYIQREAESFAVAAYGCPLNEDEQRRRYVIKSLLHAEGLSRLSYEQRFGIGIDAGLPELAELVRHDLAMWDEDVLRLTPAGIERSDAIGPWLYSDAVKESMQLYEIK
jgi:oxygen-independent coproporphyrinogen III oxidase